MTRASFRPALLVASLLSLLAAFRAEAFPLGEDGDVIDATESVRQSVPQPPLTQATNAFAFDLFGQLRKQRGNVFFSPYSASSTLGMVFTGAKGETEKEIARALHLDKLDAAKSQRREAFLQSIQERLVAEARMKGPQELHIANALWSTPDTPLRTAFVAGIRDSFSGEIQKVDFNNESAARAKINGWVEDQTQGRIKDLIPVGVLTPLTRLVLTNAVYFKAAWEHPFSKFQTRKDAFHVSPSQKTHVDMMRQTEHFRLTEADGLKMLKLPYEGNKASMLVILPDRAEDLPAIEETLTAEKLDGWLAQGKEVRVAVTIPRFRNENAYDLIPAMTGMGVTQAFKPHLADFGDIAQAINAPLYIGAFLHKAFINVDEAGTEAAAASAMAAKTTAMLQKNAPIPFTADHPFLYLIRAEETGDILFIGRMSDPA